MPRCVTHNLKLYLKHNRNIQQNTQHFRKVRSRSQILLPQPLPDSPASVQGQASPA